VADLLNLVLVAIGGPLLLALAAFAAIQYLLDGLDS
jgi:hypothetical protein